MNKEKSITLDAISQLATVFMSHHMEEESVTINAKCKESGYRLVVEIKKVPK